MAYRIRGAGINIQYRVPSDRSLIESYIIIQKEQGILQQHNIKPNKQRGIHKINSMLEPNNKTIHTILQQPKKVSLSCHVQNEYQQIYLVVINLQWINSTSFH